MTVAVRVWKPRRGIRSGAYLCSGALLLSASLALFLPAAASASSLPPPCCSPPEYSNSITFTDFHGVMTGGSGPFSTPTSIPTVTDSLGSSASTTNMYNIPSLSAQVTAGAGGITNVIDNLTYNIMFAGTGSGTTSVNVQASTTLTGAGTVSESILGVLSLSDTQSVNESLPFTINQIYTVTMLINLFPEFGGTASASADPIFTPLDAGITLETSAGIGNNSPVGATPIPAALPLFATGIGGLGLLGWRRKRKAQAVA
jgi:hypothetical protein